MSLSFNSRLQRSRQQGFSLLELIVVLLLVGLISTLLMQGFVYVAGVFQTVERRQQVWSQQLLQRNWLVESVRTLTNGVAGPLAQGYHFKGDAQGFSGLAVYGLSYSGGVARPVHVEWQLLNEQNILQLRYRELPLRDSALLEKDANWYVMGRWPHAAGAFTYAHNEQWSRQFSAVPRSGEQLSARLPQAIRLQIDAGPRSMDVLVKVAVTPIIYRAPEPDRDIF